jgi:hypothetical protein
VALRRAASEMPSMGISLSCHTALGRDAAKAGQPPASPGLAQDSLAAPSNVRLGQPNCGSTDDEED